MTKKNTTTNTNTTTETKTKTSDARSSSRSIGRNGQGDADIVVDVDVDVDVEDGGYKDDDDDDDDRSSFCCSTYYRWQPFWIGLNRPYEHLFTIDQFTTWRRHIIWSKTDGKELRSILTQRFSSNSVFLSLLVAALLGVLFSPSKPADEFRQGLRHPAYDTVEFYAGLVLCLAIIASIVALYINFTAWSIISSISDENVHSLLRSSLGLYCSQLPSRSTVLAIYLFFFTIVLLLYVIMTPPWATSCTALSILLLVHVSSTYSALGNLIQTTGAMSRYVSIFAPTDHADRMVPRELYRALLKRYDEIRDVHPPVPISQQYRRGGGERGGGSGRIDDAAIHAAVDGGSSSSSLTRRRLETTNERMKEG